jgi:N-acetylglucosamine kinase-like BadF-type ATPase
MPQVATASELFGGVDGGGSKTLAVIVDCDGNERGRATAGSSNFTAVGAEQSAAAVTQAVAEAVEIAGGRLPVRSLWAGLSGIDRQGAREQLQSLIQPLSGNIRLTNDAELIFSALEGGVGVVLIAGTGSIALGHGAAGATARAGGWGHLMGDEGSGYDIGRRALQAAARAADGRGPATALLEAFMRHWDVERPFDMIAHAYGSTDKAAVAELSSIVFAAANDGDPVARRILSNAAGELASAAIAAGDQLALPDGVLPLALTGGLLAGNAEFRRSVLRRISARRRVGQVSIVTDSALSAARSLVRGK